MGVKKAIVTGDENLSVIILPTVLDILCNKNTYRKNT